MAVRLTMCQEDRDEYGGPEVLTFDPAALLDERAGVLEEYEATTGVVITDLFHGPLRYTARGIRATLWIARRRAGLEDDWNTFNPRVLRVVVDADPPAKKRRKPSTPPPSAVAESEPS